MLYKCVAQPNVWVVDMVLQKAGIGSELAVAQEWTGGGANDRDRGTFARLYDSDGARLEAVIQAIGQMERQRRPNIGRGKGEDFRECISSPNC